MGNGSNYAGVDAEMLDEEADKENVNKPENNAASDINS